MEFRSTAAAEAQACYNAAEARALAGDIEGVVPVRKKFGPDTVRAVAVMHE